MIASTLIDVCMKCGGPRVNGPPASRYCGPCFLTPSPQRARSKRRPLSDEQWCSTCYRNGHSAWACKELPHA